MINFLRFLISKKSFLFFVLLELFSLILIIKTQNYARVKTSDWQTAMSGLVSERINAIHQHFNLKSYNDSLLHQNAQLLQKLVQPRADTLAPVLTDQFIYIPAYIISKQYEFDHNTLLINKGYNDGIRPDMGVVTANSVIGVIQKTSEHFARLISILNTGSKLSVALNHTNYTGFLQWEGKNPNMFNIIDMPVNAGVKTGDTIITSGMSSYFPKGIPVGTIVSFKTLPGHKSYIIKMKTLIDMTNIGPVYIIKNRYKKEIDSL